MLQKQQGIEQFPDLLKGSLLQAAHILSGDSPQQNWCLGTRQPFLVT